MADYRWPKLYRVLRDVKRTECVRPGLPSNLYEGQTVWEVRDHTLCGCITPGGIAVRIHLNGPFYEVPRDAIGGWE